MVTEYGWLAGLPTLSVTVMVKLYVPAEAEPVIAPVVELIEVPVGSAPEETVHVYPGVPPVTMMVWLYAPTSCVGSDAVVMLGPAIIVTEYDWLPCSTRSSAVIMKLNMPGFVGVPVIVAVGDTPVDSCRPSGNAPDETLQLQHVGNTSFALSVCEYCGFWPTSPPGNTAGVMLGWAQTPTAHAMAVATTTIHRNWRYGIMLQPQSG